MPDSMSPSVYNTAPMILMERYTHSYSVSNTEGYLRHQKHSYNKHSAKNVSLMFEEMLMSSYFIARQLNYTEALSGIITKNT